MLWYPDFCPAGGCIIELDNWDGPKSIVRLCNHHASIKAANTLDDLGIFRVILQSSRVKEAARATVKRELGLDKNHPGVRYRINSDGSFALLTATVDLAWTRDDGSAGPLPSINNAARTRARTRALADAALVESPAGTSTVTVE